MDLRTYRDSAGNPSVFDSNGKALEQWDGCPYCRSGSIYIIPNDAFWQKLFVLLHLRHKLCCKECFAEFNVPIIVHCDRVMPISRDALL